MIKFSGYIENLNKVPEKNDMENIVLFLSEVRQIYYEYGENENTNIFNKLDKDYLTFYQFLERDFKRAIQETVNQLDREINNIRKYFIFGTEYSNRKYSYLKLKKAGLTGSSLKLKLNVNKANWTAFNAKKINNKGASESDKEDAKSIIDLTQSILESLIAAWGIGDSAKELLDVLKSIINKAISLS